MRNHCSYLTDGLLETLQVVAIAVVGLFANLIFFTTLLWTVARPLGWAYAAWQPALRVPEECTPGLAAEAAEGAGCFDQVGLTGQAGWALAAGGIALAGVALGMFVRMFQPGWPLRHSLRRLAVVLVVAGAALGLVTIVLPELIVFTRNVLGGEPQTGPVSEATGAGSSSDKGAANLGFIATAGAAATVVALVVQVVRPLRWVAWAGARAVSEATHWTARLSRGLRRVANMVLGSLVGPVALAAAALFILNGGAQAARPSRVELVVWAVMALLTLVMLLFADVTSWSLHPFYKWRLSRTFAAVRVADGTPGGKATLLPYEVPLTLSEFAPDRFPGSRPGRPAFPELLVCSTVNVSVSSPAASAIEPVVVPGMAGWRRRLLHPTQVELDTEAYGPLEVDTADYEGRVGTRRRRDIALGRGGHVGRGRRPVDGQDDPGAAAVPAGAHQCAPRRLAAEPRPACPPAAPEAGRPARQPPPGAAAVRGHGPAPCGRSSCTSPTAATSRTWGCSSCSGAAAPRSCASTPPVARRPGSRPWARRWRWPRRC